MKETILINSQSFEVYNYQEETTAERMKLSFDFTVTNETYHDVTTLLYENDFIVQVLGRQLEFPATIHTYYTSFTNLYETNSVSEYHLELIEKK
ncbi:DUF3219 family protein [Oceanobacillus sp. CAU 1775]